VLLWLLTTESQTRPLDSIVIIDNASIDGTEEFLNKNYLYNPIFDYVRLPENTGGAGGFYEGAKRGHEKGFDWIWLMDDDGLLDKNALKELLRHKTRYYVLNSFVISKQNPKKMCFSLVHNPTKKVIRLVKDAHILSQEGLLDGGNFFNGTLISKIVISKVGYPNKEMFIWGDEKDYHCRISKHFQIKTVLKSILIHPENLHSNQKTFLKMRMFDYSWKEYYAIRNYLYLTKQYYDLKFMRALKLFIEIFISSVICFNKKKARIFFKAYRDGLLGRLGQQIGEETETGSIYNND